MFIAIFSLEWVFVWPFDFRPQKRDKQVDLGGHQVTEQLYRALVLEVLVQLNHTPHPPPTPVQLSQNPTPHRLTPPPPPPLRSHPPDASLSTSWQLQKPTAR